MEFKMRRLCWIIQWAQCNLKDPYKTGGKTVTIREGNVMTTARMQSEAIAGFKDERDVAAFQS